MGVPSTTVVLSSIALGTNGLDILDLGPQYRFDASKNPQALCFVDRQAVPRTYFQQYSPTVFPNSYAQELPTKVAVQYHLYLDRPPTRLHGSKMTPASRHFPGTVMAVFVNVPLQNERTRGRGFLREGSQKFGSEDRERPHRSSSPVSS